MQRSPLQESLWAQTKAAECEDGLLHLAEIIIGNIDDWGYLKHPVDELSLPPGASLNAAYSLMEMIQGFEPDGVGARDLRECLLIQLKRAGREATLEHRIISEQMQALGKRMFSKIAVELHVCEEEVLAAVDRISHLEPRPGRPFFPENRTDC